MRYSNIAKKPVSSRDRDKKEPNTSMNISTKDRTIAIITLSYIVHSNLLTDSLGYNIVSPSKDNLLCPLHTGLRDILTMF